MKKLFCLIFLFFSVLTFSQQLKYLGNGNISDSNGQKLNPSEVKKLIAFNPALLKYYTDAREKKTVGNILMLAGTALIVSDLAIGATADVKYPTALTYIGVGTLLISIPIKVGFSNKIEKVVNDYNNGLVYSKSLEINDLSFITNQNGIGFQITF